MFICIQHMKATGPVQFVKVRTDINVTSDSLPSLFPVNIRKTPHLLFHFFKCFYMLFSEKEEKENKKRIKMKQTDKKRKNRDQNLHKWKKKGLKELKREQISNVLSEKS